MPRGNGNNNNNNSGNTRAGFGHRGGTTQPSGSDDMSKQIALAISSVTMTQFVDDINSISTSGDTLYAVTANILDYLENNNKNTLLKSIDDFNNEITAVTKDILKEVKKLPVLIEDYFNSLNNNGGVVSSTNFSISGADDFAVFLNAVKRFSFNEKGIESFDNLAEIFEEDGAMTIIFKRIEELVKDDKKLEIFSGTLDKLQTIVNKTANVGTSVDKRSLASAIQNIVIVGELMTGMIGLGILLLTVGLLGAFMNINAIITFTLILSVFVVSVIGTLAGAAILMKTFNVEKTIDDFSGIVSKSALMMILGGLAISYIGITPIIGFAVVLSAFIASITFAYVKILDKKTIDNVNRAVDALGDLVIRSTFALILGSLAVHLLNWQDMLLFIGYLSFMIFSVVLLYKWFAKDYKELSNAAKWLTGLIIASTFVMMLGALAVQHIPFLSLVKFVFYLGFFLISTSLVLKLVSKWFTGEGVKDTRNAIILVTAASFIMILGSVAVKHISFFNLIKFTATLSLFLTGIMLALRVAGKGVNKSLRYASKIAMLVSMSAAIMLIGGGLFMRYPALTLWCGVFVTELSLFLLALGSIVRLLTTMKTDKALTTMGSLSMLVAIASSALLIGGKMLYENPGLSDDVIKFGAILIGFVGVMSIIVGLLSLIPKTKLYTGMAALAVISGCLVALSLAFTIMSNAYKVVAEVGFDDFKWFIVYMGAVVGGMALLVGGIGALVSTGVGALVAGAGIAAMVAIVALIDYLANTMIHLANANKAVKEAGQFDAATIKLWINSLFGILTDLKSTFGIKQAINFRFILSTLNSLSKTISVIGETVKDYAELKIPIYSGTKIVGYRTLSIADFNNASTNVSLLVTTLTKGIMQAYEEHPEWYGQNVFVDVFKGGTPLMKVIYHSKMLGPLLSKIANSVKDYANLRIPIYNGSKVSGYRTLKDSDFNKAAENISNVVTIMTQGIMDAYDKHPEWYGTVFTAKSIFDTLSNSGTPLQRVLKQSMLLPKLLSKVSKALMDYVDLRIPIWDENTDKVKGYRSMSSSDFTKAATNITNVVTLMSEAIMGVYDQHSDWYDESWWTGDSPFKLVIETNMKLSKLISKVSSSVKDYVDLRVPVWDENSNKIKNYRSMSEADFTNAATNITKILSIIGLGLMKTYEDHPDWYDSNIFVDSPFTKVLDTNKDLAKVISTTSASVKDYANLRITDEWDKDGKPIKWRQMNESDFQKAGEGIRNIITTVANGLMSAEDVLADKKLKKVTENAIHISEIVSNMAKGVAAYARLKIPKSYDEKGNPTSYFNLSQDSFDTATDSITRILTTIVGTIVKLYMGKDIPGLTLTNAEVKELQKIWKKKNIKETPIYNIITISSQISELLKTLANTLIDVNKLQIDTTINADGKTQLESKIDVILTILPNVFYNTFIKDNKYDSLFSVDEPVESSKIYKIVNIINYMSASVTAISNALVIMNNNLIKPETIQRMKESVELIIPALAESLLNITTMPGADKLWSNEALDKIVASTNSMLSVVGGMATVMKDISSLAIPSEFDETGKAKKYIKMQAPDFEKAKTNILNIVTCLGSSMNEVLSDEKNSWLKDVDDSLFARIGFGDRKTKTTSSMLRVIQGIFMMTQILSTMSGCIVGYATMRFPMGISQDGSVIYSEKISNAQIRDAKTNIIALMSTLGEVMVDVNNNTSFTKLLETNIVFDKIKDVVTSFVDNINSIVIKLNDFIKNDVNSISNISNIITQLSLLNNSLASINQSMVDTYDIFYTKVYSENDNLYNILNNDDSKFETLSKNFSSFSNNISSILNNISSLYINVKDTENNVKSFSDMLSTSYIENLRNVVENLTNVLTSISLIGNIDTVFTENKNQGWFNKAAVSIFGDTVSNKPELADNQIKRIKDQLTIYGDLISFVVNSISEMSMKISSINIIDSDKFGSLMTSFYDAIGAIHKSINAVNISNEAAKNVTYVIDMYSESLEKLFNIVVKLQDISSDNFNVLADGIIKINTSISSMNTESLDLFRKQTNTMEKMVKTVNSLKPNNLDNLNKFVTSLNQLASKLGNIDKLTEALAVKLSSVLEKLTQRLEHAEETIIKADNIQKRRHDLIGKSVEEIRSIMNQPMTVDIRQVKTTEDEE